jgi:hypothetical protein
MLRLIKKEPWFLFLLPVFFVLHGYNENFGYISFGDILILLIIYLIAALVLFIVFLFIFSNRIYAAISAGYLLFFYLFFGALQDFSRQHVVFLSRYSVLIPLFVITFCLIIVLMKWKKWPVKRLNFFLNVLLLIYLSIETFSLTVHMIKPQQKRLSLKDEIPELQAEISENSSRPDIYFLIFDEYASSSALKKYYQFDNHLLDSFLVRQQFHLIPGSKSNYNFTPFSIASILNMNYITNINPGEISIQEYAKCNELIKDNKVCEYLEANGYSINNFSSFDLKGQPRQVVQSLLPYKTSLITDATLFSRMRKDLIWWLMTGNFKQDWLTEKFLYANRYLNIKIEELIIKSSFGRSPVPRFFYCHFYLPHPPFYNSGSGLKPAETIAREWEELDTKAYLDYVTFTNLKIFKIISAIKQATKGKAVIIFMGDHGFRKQVSENFYDNYFENQNAVYLPSKDYTSWPDTLSGVNEFRIIFNDIYSLQLPLLKDSSIFLKDKK